MSPLILSPAAVATLAAPTLVPAQAAAPPQAASRPHAEVQLAKPDAENQGPAPR